MSPFGPSDEATVEAIAKRVLRGSDLAVLVRQLQGLVGGAVYDTGAASGATTSTTYVGTAPNIVVPFSGDFIVHVQAQTNGPTHVSADGAGFTANDEDGFYTPASSTGYGMFRAGLTGGETLGFAFRSVDGGSRSLVRPRMLLTPIR